MKFRVVAVCLCALSPLFPHAARASGGAGAAFQAALWSYGDTATGTEWSGADGTYSVRLPDGREVVLFSDTFLGPVNADHSRPSSAQLIHNSIVVRSTGGAFSTLIGTVPLLSSPTAEITPADRASFYWLGDAIVVNGNELDVFCMRFVEAPVPFAFQQAGVDIARFDLPSMTLRAIEPAPQAFLPAPTPVSYGSAILEKDGWDYVYGSEDIHLDKYLHVARAPVGRLSDPTAWRYWDGSAWSNDAATSARLMGGIANEFSVSYYKGQYLLVTQHDAVQPLIDVETSSAPTGPWSVVQQIPLTLSAGLTSYNAKAHPELSTSDDLVISYNVNGSDDYSNVDNYRPRFIDCTLTACSAGAQP